MILLDTSGLLAALFSDQRHHEACASSLVEESGPFVLSPFVLAELDYLIGKHAGVAAQRAFLCEIAAGVYDLAVFDRSDIANAERVVAQYEDLALGLADASLVVLSNKLRITKLLSLDQRHFRVVRGHGERPFDLLPFDS